MKDGDELIGLVLLTRKQKGKEYTYADFSVLSSICSVCSLAVKNSRLYEKAYYEARRDELTGLYNRKSFYETAAKLFNQRNDRSLALVHLNVDDFKLYNQLYGNGEGDKALRRIADIIRASSEGKGMGIKFLKHIERTHSLAFLIDMSDENALNAFDILLGELNAYSHRLAEKKRIILASKMDVQGTDKVYKKFSNKLKGETIFPLSVYNKDMLEEVKKAFIALRDSEGDNSKQMKAKDTFMSLNIPEGTVFPDEKEF